MGTRAALTFSDDGCRALATERYQHPNPRVQRRMETLWLLSQGETQVRAGQLAGISRATVERHVALFRQRGVAGLRKFRRVRAVNLASHKRAAAVRAIERAGGTAVYLPPYSPDLNPIELAFAKIKARLRAAELRAIDKVERFFGAVHEAFTPDECRAYIRHAGYTATL